MVMVPLANCPMLDCKTTVRFLSGARFHISLLIAPLRAGPEMVMSTIACSVRAPLSVCPACASNCVPRSDTGVGEDVDEDLGMGVTDGEDVDALPLQAARVSKSSNNAHGNANFSLFI